MWRRPACQNLSKTLDISSATARVAPDLLKALAILSDTTMRRSAVDREDLKPTRNCLLIPRAFLLNPWQIMKLFLINAKNVNTFLRSPGSGEY